MRSPTGAPRQHHDGSHDQQRAEIDSHRTHGPPPWSGGQRPAQTPAVLEGLLEKAPDLSLEPFGAERGHGEEGSLVAAGDGDSLGLAHGDPQRFASVGGYTVVFGCFDDQNALGIGLASVGGRVKIVVERLEPVSELVEGPAILSSGPSFGLPLRAALDRSPGLCEGARLPSPALWRPNGCRWRPPRPPSWLHG